MNEAGWDRLSPLRPCSRSFYPSTADRFYFKTRAASGWHGICASCSKPNAEIVRLPRSPCQYVTSPPGGSSRAHSSNPAPLETEFTALLRYSMGGMWKPLPDVSVVISPGASAIYTCRPNGRDSATPRAVESTRMPARDTAPPGSLRCLRSSGPQQSQPTLTSWAISMHDLSTRTGHISAVHQSKY